VLRDIVCVLCVAREPRTQSQEGDSENMSFGEFDDCHVIRNVAPETENSLLSRTGIQFRVLSSYSLSGLSLNPVNSTAIQGPECS
jgi:hypothetical protein